MPRDPRAALPVSDLLFALWIALMSADRIDAAGARGAFLLTPFLVLTPFVVAVEATRAARRGRLTLSPGGLAYAALAGALLCVVLVSSVLALDVAISAARAGLLMVQVAGTLTIAALCRDRAELASLLARGALLGLMLFALFNVGESLWWVGRGPEALRLGFLHVKFSGLQSLGPLPRLAGPVGDGNRAGFVLLCYVVFLLQGQARPALRRSALGFAFVFLLATFSRSALLGLLAAGVVALLTNRLRVPGPRWVLGGALAVASCAAVLLVSPRSATALRSAVLPTVGERFDLSRGSAQSHLTLVERGLGEATASIPRALIGTGWGNSHLLLQDVFPGNKYGSFHSLYVTTFAEAGVFALLFTLLLLGVPLLAGNPWRPVVAGAVAFNLFYQTNTEPLFWFVLALAWLTLDRWPAALPHYPGFRRLRSQSTFADPGHFPSEPVSR